jgi:lipopolysaccharide/colanic/teichoic acid biosynthesis glycosyltransferase
MSARPPAERGPGIPRIVEAPLALVGLLLCSPLIATAGVAVALTSRGPAFFWQERVGRGGQIFRLCKLRTMQEGSAGPQVTAAGDPRVTPVGRLLRKTKLDEVPQLWNVLRGEMSFVGPRPEVPRYVDLEDPLWREVLTVRPGITDPVTIFLRDEEAVLAEAPGDCERFYREQLLPYKLEKYALYLRGRTWWSDIRVILATVGALVAPVRRPDAGRARTKGESGRIAR